MCVTSQYGSSEILRCIPVFLSRKLAEQNFDKSFQPMQFRGPLSKIRIVVIQISATVLGFVLCRKKQSWQQNRNFFAEPLTAESAVFVVQRLAITCAAELCDAVFHTVYARSTVLVNSISLKILPRSL